MLVMDADLGKIRSVRRKNKSVKDAVSLYGKVEPMRTIDCRRGALRSDGSLYPLQSSPFVAADPVQRKENSDAIFAIQTAGLRRRLQTIHAVPVLGVSGGLDSALALLVAVEAMRRLGRPLTDVYGITMPCFGTTKRTKSNAEKLSEALSVPTDRIYIKYSTNNFQ